MSIDSGGGYKSCNASTWSTIVISSKDKLFGATPCISLISRMYGWQTRWFLPGCHVGLPMCALFSGFGKNDKANGSLRVRWISKLGRYRPVTLLTRDGDHGP